MDLTAVETPKHPERTIVFTLTQESSIGDGSAMLLKVASGFPGVLKYRLGLMRLDSDQLFATSSCPLKEGKPVFEGWPDPIFQIVASSFRLVDPTSQEARTCE